MEKYIYFNHGNARKKKDISGEIFGELTVVSFSHREKNENRNCYDYFWNCICKCGKQVVRKERSLKEKKNHNQIISCGCSRGKFFKENNPKKTHGLSKTRIYKIYCKMKERCYYKEYPEFYLYGGRGIKICDEWLNDFKTFYKWALENNYNENLSIDRIDYNGDYEPNNCRWADNIAQANNKRNNIVLTHNGQTHTMPEWARILNLPYSTLANRRKKGKSVEEILNPNKLR